MEVLAAVGSMVDVGRMRLGVEEGIDSSGLDEGTNVELAAGVGVLPPHAAATITMKPAEAQARYTDLFMTVQSPFTSVEDTCGAYRPLAECPGQSNDKLAGL